METPIKLWVSEDVQGYAIGTGDKQLATGLDRETAMLFKAAPEMLMRLKEMAICYCDLCTWPFANKQCEENKLISDLIAKAEGKYE